MKSKTTSPLLYQFSQTKDASVKLTTWAYTTLIKPGSPHAKKYPIDGANCLQLTDGSWGINFSEKPAQKPDTSESIKLIQQPNEFQESLRIRHALEEIAVDLQKASDLSKRYYTTDFISRSLSSAIGKAAKLLSQLSATPCKWSAEQLWLGALKAVIELENAYFHADTFPMLQYVARKQIWWPVIYPQNKGELSQLKKNMARLGLGSAAYQKLGAPKRNSPSGKYAQRIGHVLHRIHFDGNLRMCLSPIAGESPSQRKERLEMRGWTPWIVKLHQLPELTADSAPEWFEVGWQALTDATGGNITSDPELALLGKSNAEYAKTKATTERGKKGKHISRIESQAKRLLKNAFLKRFGN